jgi:hypothetical protein
MAAGDTGVSICSDALILLGAKPISSFNDGTDESNTCDRLYPDVRDMTLSMYPWSFSYKKAALSQLITTPATEWRYEYQLPGDRLAIHAPCSSPTLLALGHTKSGKSLATS